MEAITMIALIALVSKIVTVIKSIGKDNNTVVTQVLVWVVGVLVFLLAANSDIASGIEPISGHPLSGLDVGSLVLLGLSLGSAGSFAYDFKRDRAPEPSLIRS